MSKINNKSCRLKPAHNDCRPMITWLRLMNIIYSVSRDVYRWPTLVWRLQTIQTPWRTIIITLIYNARLLKLPSVLDANRRLNSIKSSSGAFHFSSAHTPLQSKYCAPLHPAAGYRARCGEEDRSSLSFVSSLPRDAVHGTRLPSGVAESAVFGKHSCPKLKSSTRARAPDLWKM